MKCINLQNNNPYFCLAAEEYFLKNYSEDIFLIWQSQNTVVVGDEEVRSAFEGRAFGAEFQARINSAKRFKFNLAYTLFRSELKKCI